MSSPDPDLRDVFKLLYAEDDWDSLSDDEEGIHPPLNSLIPEIELDVIESSLTDQSTQDEVIQLKEKYNRKRYLDALDSLLSPSSLFPSSSPSKKQRIYPSLPTKPSSSMTLSTSPLPTLPSPGEYLPYSPLGLLSKLRTYQIYTYTHAEDISPIKGSLNGWIISEKNTFTCGQCGSKWGLGGLDDIRDENVRKEVVRRSNLGLEGRHKEGCAWRVRRSPDELYDQLRNLLHPQLTTNLTPLSISLHSSIPNSSSINLESPLTQTQEDNLISTIQNHSSSSSSSSAHPTRESILLSFFGWFPYFPNSPSTSDHIPSNLDKVDTTEIVSCRICQRRIGLWTFINQSHTKESNIEKDGKQAEEKILDLVGEHLNWCPLNIQDSKKWWEDSGLIKEKNTSSIQTKDWVKISEKMEKKPWRR